MDKTRWLKIINPLLLVFVLVQAITGLGFIFHIFSAEAFRIAAKVHKICGILLPVFAFIHLGFNWPWIKSVFFKK